MKKECWFYASINYFEELIHKGGVSRWQMDFEYPDYKAHDSTEFVATKTGTLIKLSCLDIKAVTSML